MLNEEYLDNEENINDHKSKDLNNLLFDRITGWNDNSGKNLNYTKIIVMIGELWKDPGIRKCLHDYRSHFHIADNVDYFFDNIHRIFGSTIFIPTLNDTLRFRMRTTGFTQDKFDVYFDVNQANIHQFESILNENKNNNDNNNANGNGNDVNRNDNHSNNDSPHNNPDHHQYKTLNRSKRQKFVFLDVGGQRNERKKWMKMMKDDINAILYIVAISEFDLGCYEDSHTLRLHEAMDLFGEVIDAGFLDNKTHLLIILVMKTMIKNC